MKNQLQVDQMFIENVTSKVTLFCATRVSSNLYCLRATSLHTEYDYDCWKCYETCKFPNHCVLISVTFGWCICLPGPKDQ